jgi:sarcosine oxidase
VAAERVEIVVVGAGIVGLATAWQLARRGHEVLVLEQDAVGHARGSSHGASRVFRQGYDDPDYVDMAVAALPRWAELEDAAGDAHLYTRTGALVGGPGMAGVRAALEAAGVACEVLDEREARRRHPEVALAGPVLFEPDAGVLAADRCLAGCVRAVRAAGGAVREHTRVSAVDEDGGAVELTTAAGAVRARVAVLCCGAWAPELLAPAGVTFPFVVTREQIGYVAPRDPAGALALASVPVVIEWGEPAHYGLPTPALGWYKLAEHGTGPPVDAGDARRSLAPDPAVGARLARAAARLLPGFTPELVASETCLYDNPPDRDFILDRRGHLVVGAGTAGHGFKFAPLLGEALADLALGGDPPVPRTRFSLARPALRTANARLKRPR